MMFFSFVSIYFIPAVLTSIKKPKYKFSRAKQIFLIAKEQRVLEIVTPLFKFAAFTIGASKADTMPSFVSMQEALFPAKVKLSALMAYKLGVLLDPNSLSVTGVSTTIMDGHFTISVRHFTKEKNEAGLEIVNCYNLELVNEKRASLVESLIAIQQKKIGRELTVEQKEIEHTKVLML